MQDIYCEWLDKWLVIGTADGVLPVYIVGIRSTTGVGYKYLYKGPYKQCITYVKGGIQI